MLAQVFDSFISYKQEIAEKQDADNSEDVEHTEDTDDPLQIFLNHFKLPISYQTKKTDIHELLSSDLELIQTHDKTNKSILEKIFQPKDVLAQKSIHQWNLYFCYDADFIKDTQTFIQSLTIQEKHIDHSNNETTYFDVIKLKKNEFFLSEYNYVELPFFHLACDQLNSSSVFLQILTIVNMASPVFSLMIPFCMLLVPFFILKFRGTEITMSSYLGFLKNMLQNSNIGRIFANFSNASLNQKAYLLFSLGLYVFQMYQNVVLCWKFHKNLCKIHTTILQLRLFLSNTFELMNDHLIASKVLPTYKTFNNELISQKNQIHHMICLLYTSDAADE